jgi:hypothetical protein
MTRCPSCPGFLEQHDPECEHFVPPLDEPPDADRTTRLESAMEILRDDPVERAIYRYPYPPEWDIEDDKPPKYEYRVTHRRAGGERNRWKLYQRPFFALRRFRRLMRSSGRAGLAPIEYLVLERREVGEWETLRRVL